jgi:cytochrome c2
MQERIRDMVRLADGTLLLLTDATGYLIFLADGGAVFDPLTKENLDRIAELERYGTMVGGGALESELRMSAEVAFSTKCGSCHSLESVHGLGPHLLGLFGREVGSVEGYGFSQNLLVAGEDWTPELLREFLATPDDIFPGTRMPALKLADSEVDSVIAHIERGGESR